MANTACDWSVLTCGTTKLDELDPEVRAEVEGMAVDALWKWTGRRFGDCPVTVRPCRRRCWDGAWLPYWPIITLGARPLLDDANVPLYTDGGSLLTDGSYGAVFSAHCGRCRGECGCTEISEVVLPGPVTEVLEVLIDGVPLDETTYRVDDYVKLVRLDGEWPICQDLNVADDQEGAWAITYRRNEPVPPGGKLIAGALAIELAKALCNDASCRLPKRVNTLTRQGMTAVFFDTFKDLQAGQTGVWEVDYWVTTQNKPRYESVVNSPDLQKVRRTTWTASPSS